MAERYCFDPTRKKGQLGLYVKQVCDPGDQDLAPYLGANQGPGIVPGQGFLPGGEVPTINTPIGQTSTTNVAINAANPTTSGTGIPGQGGTPGNDWGKALTGFLNNLQDPNLWKGVGLVIAAGLAVLLGVYLWAGHSAGDVARVSTSTGKRIVEAAA